MNGLSGDIVESTEDSESPSTSQAIFRDMDPMALRNRQVFSTDLPTNGTPTIEPFPPDMSSHCPGTSQPVPDSPFILTGFREQKDEESNLIAVLDSLIPFIRGNDSSVKLPVFIGNLETVTETVTGDYSGKST
jgi:hypothetical protein